MKYGDTIQQRSIPAWQTHNIDYHDIKHFIKISTTPAKGKGLAIPGATDTIAIDFENNLLQILKEQDERITWFVRSKVGEIQRRLVHLDQQITRCGGQPGDLPAGRVSVKKLERFGKIESEILKVGGEIQALSRFIGVQQEAFRKLIKKYKKWTGSSELGYRFQVEVRERHTSFTATDLQPFLDRYEELLHTIRTLYEQSQSRRVISSKPAHASAQAQPPTSTAQLAHARRVLENGTKVEFDHLIATIKLGDQGKNAVFWLHPENIVELQVLLSQHTRSFNVCHRQPSVASLNSGPSSPTLTHATHTQPDTFDIVADEPKRYLARMGSETVSDVEIRKDITLQKAALHARCTTTDDVAMLAWTAHDESDRPRLETCAVKRKFTESLVGCKTQLPSQKAAAQQTSTDGSSTTATESVEQLQAWLKAHEDVRPITTILTQRARFWNTSNNAAGVLIATLDHNIHFQQGATSEAASGAAAIFPHAVLRIRQEGRQTSNLIQILNSSHLVERVPGFSLEHHAVWQATQPSDISPPSWLPLLSQDLRKVPQPATSSLHKASTEFGSQSTTPQLSTATSSEAGCHFLEPVQPPLSSRQSREKARTSPIIEGPNKANTRTRKTSFAPVNESRLVKSRYYSEYDDPDASDDDNAYVIFIDPNEKTVFDKVWQRLRSLVSKRPTPTPETEPLLYSPSLSSHGDEADDYESSDDEDVVPYRLSRIYGNNGIGLGVDQESAARRALAAVPRFGATCFAASVSILFVAFVLAATGRRKLSREVDAGVLFAVAVSLTFAILGTVSLYRSGEHLRGWMWGAAGVVLCVVAVGSGGLVAWIVT